MNLHIAQALGEVAGQMARYGSATGITIFETLEEGETFRRKLRERYPFTGYGTSVSKPERQGESQRYFVKWWVGSCE